MSHITWQDMSDMSKQMFFHMFHVLFILAPFGPHHGPQTVCVVSDSEPPEVPMFSPAKARADLLPHPRPRIHCNRPDTVASW